MIEKNSIGGLCKYIIFLLFSIIWLFSSNISSLASETNVSILDPNGNENFWTEALGYFQYSTDGGVTWSGKMTDQNETLWYTSPKGIYIRHIRENYILKDMTVVEGNASGFYSNGSGGWYHKEKNQKTLTQVDSTTYKYTGRYSSVCIHINTIAHTHNTNNKTYTSVEQKINNGHAQHKVHIKGYCDANDGYYEEDYSKDYWEDCYDVSPADYLCDLCGRQAVWKNINVLYPGATDENMEDCWGGTARFDVVSYHTGDGRTQYHFDSQQTDQPSGAFWVGTQIRISNIQMQNAGYVFSKVTGATWDGNAYVYTVDNVSGTKICIYTDYKKTTLYVNPNGGSYWGSTGIYTKQYMQYSKNYYDAIDPASRPRYTFDGWWSAASGGTQIYDRNGNAIRGTVYFDTNGNNLCTEDLTIYAHWKDAPGYHNGQAIVYTITYNLFPKNGSGVKITDPGNPTTYTVETPTFTLKNPSATNYSFEGWYGSGSKSSKGVTIVQGSIGDLHFTADWLPTKDTNKSSGQDQNLPYVKTTDIIENNYKLAS